MFFRRENLLIATITRPIPGPRMFGVEDVSPEANFSQVAGEAGI
jgi:hypothetical protein